MVLGDVQGVDAEPVVGFGELEPVLEELREGLAARIHVIENAELHLPLSLRRERGPTGMLLHEEAGGGGGPSGRRTMHAMFPVARSTA